MASSDDDSDEGSSWRQCERKRMHSPDRVPAENESIIYHKWEDEIIWDAQQINDIDPSTINQITGPPPKIKIPHPHVKKSKILLGNAGVINVLPPPKGPNRDPFNISNDWYYACNTEPTLRLKVGDCIQQSTPVIELRAPLVPTHLEEEQGEGSSKAKAKTKEDSNQ